jgi:hypothetical protein
LQRPLSSSLEALPESAVAIALDSSDSLPQRVDGEARQSHISIAQEAAFSRLCPIQDAYDFWSLLEGRSVARVGSCVRPLQDWIVFAHYSHQAFLQQSMIEELQIILGRQLNE